MIVIFNTYQEATGYTEKIHEYLCENRPNYSAVNWAVPEQSADGLYWMVKECIEELVQLWPVPIDVTEEKAAAIDITDPLPEVGQECLIDKFYLYNGGDVLKCRQTHNRTIYEPKDTPALFSFYRDNSAQLEWIVGEQVEVGWMRIYLDVKYEVIQAHMTQVDWTPTATLNVLWKVYHDTVGIPDWVQPTGPGDSYMIDDQVIFENAVWESLIDYNVWSPTDYPAGWNKLYDL